MKRYDWETQFLELFHRCLERYRSGDFNFEGYYSAEDQGFLKAIGYQPREFFDFVEDYGDGKDPSPAAAVLIASVRRDYLETIQKGELSTKRTRPEDLPARSEELDGFSWLPRIITKAEAKLRGELDPEIMYGCGGDRAFLHRHNLHPADFLRVVWAAEGDHQEIAAYVRSHSPS